MTRRALLIGSETSGLSGCNSDVALMRQVLEARGFDAIEVRIDRDATRAGIVDGFENLIGAIGGDDAAVVYYSGHGARVTRPDFEERKAAGLPVHFQFIVPHDMNQSEPGDFRGVLSEELTGYQRRLTDAFRVKGTVPNVTTILDCCHSGYMARSIDVVQKSIGLEAKMFRMLGVREHAEQLVGTLTTTALATNPDAVRLVACQPEQSAFEFPSTRGGRHGALTDALAAVLDELGPVPVSWGITAELVRRRVRALVPEQRPDIEGPPERLLFSSESLVQGNALAVSVVEDEFTIEAASILGIAVGDEFRLVLAGHDETIGSAVVTGVGGAGAVLGITPDSAREAVRSNALAIPTRVTVPKVQVTIEFDGVVATALRKQLADNVRVGVANDPSTAVARITEHAGNTVLSDDLGERWRVDAYPADVAGNRRLVRDIDAIAVGHRLLDLPPGDGDCALGDVVTVGFGTIDDGVRHPRPAHGERLTAGTTVFLTVTNASSEGLFVWVFDVGVSGRSSLLTNAGPSGTVIGANGTEDDTVDVWGPKGEAVFWPPDVPVPDPGGSTSGRWETFVVLTADQRGDLSSLASRDGAARGVARSALDALMDEARIGVREVAVSSPGEPPLRYRLDTVQFMLQPT
ncbi:MAG: caspase family protein [Ilumatobacteraceae bacterium]